ncbi:hypothetical protein [Brevibacillus migulae]|uniref:hypothetical protein n=1 Tax=Brevibacillus migulae TaxID=1644114 RepID=UPI00106DDC77|nr:hypothetical protein [Brevibacillus migulae]
MKPNAIVQSNAKKTKQRFSAAPWRLVSADGYDVLRMHGDFDPKYAAKNAKLIIAAQDLLETCEKALKFMENLTVNEINEKNRQQLADELRAVITAATGSAGKKRVG